MENKNKRLMTIIDEILEKYSNAVYMQVECDENPCASEKDLEKVKRELTNEIAEYRQKILDLSL